MENVLGFGSELPKFVSALHDMTGRRYVVESRKIVAQYYGVPQFRHRLFIVGVDRRVSRVVPWPTPVAREVFDYTSAFSGMISLTEALQDLGPPGAESRSLGLDHIDIPLSPEDARIAARIPNGGSLKDIPDQYLPDTYKGRERGIRGWTWYYRKPRPQLPGRTVLASIRPIYATILAPDVYIDKCDGRFVWVAVDKCKHTSKNGLYKSPVKQRRLTIRECARLQTFPDSFVFIGSPLQKHRMIGNAVPCELARRLCEAVAKTLDGTYDGALVQQLLFDG
jgi:DNA (cytosine-5)-methyltransferase 1